MLRCSNEDTGYSGYFRNGSRALIVGRYSTCCRETRRGHVRSLSLVGKLFPTTDPNHVAPLRTASFMTQQDIGGDYNDHFFNRIHLTFSFFSERILERRAYNLGKIFNPAKRRQQGRRARSSLMVS
jgi:hypothetical protein